MSKTTDIQNIRNFINNGLHLKLTPGNPENVKAAAFVVQSAIGQISNDAILFLMDNPTAKLEIHKIKPKPSNENPSAKPNKTRRN